MEESFAIEKTSEDHFRRWLFNPFYYIAGGKALGLGICFILATGVFVLLGDSVRLIGVLDFNLGVKPQASILEIFSWGLISWIVMGILLLIGGKIISKSRVRTLDVIGTQALARFPYLVTAILTLHPGTKRFAQLFESGAQWQTHPTDVAVFVLTVFVGIIMAIWMVSLMYRAFAVSCNVSGGKAISVFVAALILGEAISKFIVIFIFINQNPSWSDFLELSFLQQVTVWAA